MMTHVVSAVITRDGESRPCERFVFRFDEDPASVTALCRHLADLVKDPDLPRFTWEVAQHVAAKVGDVRQQINDAARHHRPVPPTGACFTMTTDPTTPATTPKPTPTVGRIVHYHTEGKDQPNAAVITHVWSDDCVNLHVFRDGSFPLQVSPEVTSVMRGPAPGEWSWPPRAA